MTGPISSFCTGSEKKHPILPGTDPVPGNVSTSMNRETINVGSGVARLQKRNDKIDDSIFDPIPFPEDRDADIMAI